MLNCVEFTNVRLNLTINNELPVPNLIEVVFNGRPSHAAASESEPVDLFRVSRRGAGVHICHFGSFAVYLADSLLL